MGLDASEHEYKGLESEVVRIDLSILASLFTCLIWQKAKGETPGQQLKRKVFCVAW